MTTILAEDCTEKCKSLQHGKEINTIITKHGRSDEEVLALMKKTCRNFHKIKDEFNRNALHLAASTGRRKLVEWLIKREGCDINAKDSSGYTALHRSVLFGNLDVTRTLLKLGASMNISDNEGYFPLDLIRLDKPKYITTDDKQISEAYVWGLNENYNLGTGTETPRHVPELVDRMRKLPWGHLGSCFSQIAMSPFHTVWLHWSSEVYSCGVGTSGQLGLDSTNHAFTPQRIEFRSSERCLQVSVACEHSLFRMESGAVKSCGSNEYFVLGHKQPSSKVLKPKAVDITCKTEFICASKFHSVFLAKNEIYVCGTNQGQMGFEESIKSIVKPRKMLLPFEKEEKQEGQFTHVDCNEWATAVCHSRGYICIFKKYRCVTLNTRHFDIQKIQVVGGGLDSDSSYSNDIPICVFMLLKHGRLLIWHENQEQLLSTFSSSSSSSSSSKKSSSSSSSPQFTIAVFNVGRALTITDFCVNTTSLILINQAGESFKASLNLRTNPVLFPNIRTSSSSNNTGSGEWGFQVKESMRHQIGKDLFSFMPLELFKVKRINNIYSALKTYCDCRGNNYSVTQVHQKADLLNLPQKMKTTINSDFALLLKETSIDDDIHDVTFKVKNFLFPAHRFIIASTCEVLYRDVKKKCEEMEESSTELDMTSSPSQIIVTIKNVEPRIFELILQFLYSNQCDIFIPGGFKVFPNDPDWPELLRTYAKKLQLRSLIERLHSCNVRMINGQIEMSRIINSNSVSNIKFDKNSWVSLTDVTLTSEDGYEVKAHQCVLVARLEYYKNMLQRNVWFEGTSSQQQLKFPGTKSVMDIFLDIIYRGDYSHGNFGGKKDLDILSMGLVTSDLLLSPEFLSQFEYLIMDYISHENVSQILHLACLCNAQQLRLSCIEFICLNLAPILENRLLDSLPDEQVKEIAAYYKSSFAGVLNRKLDDTSAPHDDVYEAAAEEIRRNFPELAGDIELLNHIEDLDFITPKKSQSSSKGKLKMRNRTLSSSSANNDNNNGNSSCGGVDKTINRVDGAEYYMDNNDGHHHHQDDWSNYGSSFEEFTVVTKTSKTPNGQQKQRSPPPPPTIISTPKISIPLPSHSFNLSTKMQAQVEAQQQPVSLGSGFNPKPTLIKATAPIKINSNHNSRQTNQIAFDESDFPSFGSLKSDSPSDNTSVIPSNNKNISKIINNGQRKSNSPSTQHSDIKSNSEIIRPAVNPTQSSAALSSSSHSKRKTKWVNLEEKVSSSKSTTIVSSNGDASTIQSTSCGRDMKNPWQKLSTPEKGCSTINDDNSVKFDEIVQREKLKKENLEKVKAKPLLFHQIEDEAINQLWERYGKTEDVLNGYELVNVERVSEDYAVPIWTKNL